MQNTYLPPKPGEIWELKRVIQTPIKFSEKEQNKLYSKEAKLFLQGKSSLRYVMIVSEPESFLTTKQEWSIVSVMVFSEKTNFLSNVDLLVSSKISGLAQDLLAETWHTQFMLTCNLLQPAGKRLSHDIYDILLTVGDYYHGLINNPPTISAIKDLGLDVGTQKASETLSLKIFYQQEIAWSDVLSIPTAAYNTRIKSIKFTNEILTEELKIEQELADIGQSKSNLLKTLSTSLGNKRIVLSRWLENIFETDWQVVYSNPQFVIDTRSNVDDNSCSDDEIATLVEQLSPENDEHQRRRAVKQLGKIAFGNSQAIQALVNLLRSTSDDETLWTVIESLCRIDPGNPAAGVRRVKLVDLGMQIAGEPVALAVGFVQKASLEVGVLVQVYPTDNNDYLPPDLKLILLNESSQTLYEVTARRADVYIQLKFSGQRGEEFSVRVALGETSITEDFVI